MDLAFDVKTGRVYQVNILIIIIVFTIFFQAGVRTIAVSLYEQFHVVFVTEFL